MRDLLFFRKVAKEDSKLHLHINAVALNFEEVKN